PNLLKLRLDLREIWRIISLRDKKLRLHFEHGVACLERLLRQFFVVRYARQLVRNLLAHRGENARGFIEVSAQQQLSRLSGIKRETQELAAELFDHNLIQAAHIAVDESRKVLERH